MHTKPLATPPMTEIIFFLLWDEVGDAVGVFVGITTDEDSPLCEALDVGLLAFPEAKVPMNPPGCISGVSEEEICG